MVVGTVVAVGPSAVAKAEPDRKPPPGSSDQGAQQGGDPTPPPPVWPRPTAPPQIAPRPTPPPPVGPWPTAPPQITPRPVPEPTIRPTPGPGGPIDRHTRLLILTKHRGATPFPIDRAVTLRCAPPGGTHPRIRASCRVLATVGGDPGRLNLSPRTICTRVYNPVTVTAVGLWSGHRIRFQRTYGNPCVLRAATGPVYDF